MRTSHVERVLTRAQQPPQNLGPSMTGGLDAAAQAALVERVAEHRDREAFSRLFNHFGPRLKNFFLRLGAAEAGAEELVQDTMLTLWQRAGSYSCERAAVSTWLFTIARNLSIDRQRKDRHFEAHAEFDDAAADDEDDGQSALERAQMEGQISRAVQALTPEQAEVLRMFYFQWRTTREIAEITGLAEGTVKSRMRLAMTRLRATMSET